jgi:hypothetical protein
MKNLFLIIILNVVSLGSFGQAGSDSSFSESEIVLKMLSGILAENGIA